MCSKARCPAFIPRGYFRGNDLEKKVGLINWTAECTCKSAVLARAGRAGAAPLFLGIQFEHVGGAASRVLSGGQHHAFNTSCLPVCLAVHLVQAWASHTYSQQALQLPVPGIAAVAAGPATLLCRRAVGRQVETPISFRPCTQFPLLIYKYLRLYSTLHYHLPACSCWVTCWTGPLE